MIKFNVFSMFFLVFMFHSLSANDIIDSLLIKYPINDNEVIALVFLEYGSCIKCLIMPEKIIEATKKESERNIRIVGMVNVSRKKELTRFKKDTKWKYDAEPDLKGTVRELIGCKSSNDLCFINSKSEIIAQISTSNPYLKNLDILIKALSK